MLLVTVISILTRPNALTILLEYINLFNLNRSGNIKKICDWIWENVNSSHIRFCSFGDPQKPQGMVYRFDTFRNDEGIVVLQSMKVSHLSNIPNRFYEPPKLPILGFILPYI